MAKRQIVIEVDPDGLMRATTHGYEGPDCLDEIARIEDLCGAPMVESELTSDYDTAVARETTTTHAEVPQTVTESEPPI